VPARLKESQATSKQAFKHQEMPKNMTGGSGHKRGKKGEGFRGRKAKAAAFDLLEVLLERAQIGLEAMRKTAGGAEKVAALHVLQVGRIDKMLGNGWCDVLCEDNKSRRCHIRGILRAKKGGAYMEKDSIVVVSLEKPMEELGDSDDEGHVGAGKAAGGPYAGSAFVVGLFDDDSKRQLRRAGINPKLFQVVGADGGALEDFFEKGEDDDAELLASLPRRQRKLAAAAAASKAAGGGGAAAAEAEEAEINIDDI
jgi:translation initiation factor IF-1